MDHRDIHAAAAPVRPAGLPGKLMAAVRPEFRADDLVFDPRDPVFGGPACAVSGCVRPERKRGMCLSRRQRWLAAGKPDLGEFVATTRADWHGHRPLGSCVIAGCGYGLQSNGMCQRHTRQWDYAGRPEPAAWQASPRPLLPPSRQPLTCRIGYCDLWARGTSLFCSGHDDRWRGRGRPGVEEFIASYEEGGPGSEHIDLRRLPAQLRLELQYVLQCRRDERKAKILPAAVQPIVVALAGTELSSLLDEPEHYWMNFDPTPRRGRGWRVFLLDAHRRIEALTVGQGWDIEYPRDLWRLCNLGIDQPEATFDFTKIGQPWLKELAKKWARWQLSTGLSASTAGTGVRAVTRFAVFLAAGPAAIDRLAQVDRPLLERYLAGLHADLNGRHCHVQHVGALNGFLKAIRQHRWDDTLPAEAMLFPEDYPRRAELLPRALSEQVAAQLQEPGNLARWDTPAYQLITLILMRCGLRISDAAKIPFTCVVTDADGAPYLRYYNHKMKREALVPIDEELHRHIGDQQQAVQERWPGGVPVLFPRPTANLGGQRPISSHTYRSALHRWLQACDVRDENRQLIHLTPHQWRHTLGTFLISKDVPQEVVRIILDHDSHAMTGHYARLSDTTVRRHWEAARKVNAHGETVALDPDGPLADASWARQRIGRAVQALPNGFCGLPLVQTCPHANACLTCPLFITTPDFLPQHRAQHQQTLQIITAAQARGQQRMAEMNQQVAGNLEKIITALEGDDNGHQASTDAC